MVIRLKDGTQEFISDENDLLNLIEEKLGRDISDELKFILDDLNGELEDIRCEYEDEDEMFVLESNLNEIYVLTSELIKRVLKHDNQELLMCLEEIKDLANV